MTKRHHSNLSAGTRFAKFADTERHAASLTESDPHVPEADVLLLSSCQVRAFPHMPLPILHV